jgi:centromere/kinetochore protein ZW10
MLAMFRAIAPDFYTRTISGNMYLYNDCLYLAQQLRLYSEDRLKRSGGEPGPLSLASDISALEIFGKRAYGKEMDSERTIIGHLLDGAQGFTNCTEQPFTEQCDLAIASTCDRMREIHALWKAILSPSALLQSIGSLLTTITNKIIIDIEDISDISEPESRRLTAFCQRVAELDQLFLSETQPGAEEPVSMAAVYCGSWLKFQYLYNILESSLVDIKYLWMEGELSLEFTADEVVDLVEALFADSEHRRRAIGEIRRGGKGAYS